MKFSSFRNLVISKELLLSFLFLFFLLLAIIVSVYLAGQKQLVVKKAAEPMVSLGEKKDSPTKTYFRNYLWEKQFVLTPEIIEADKKAAYKKLPQYQAILQRTQTIQPVIIPVLLVPSGERFYEEHLTIITSIMEEMRRFYERETGKTFQTGSIIIEQSPYTVKEILRSQLPFRFMGPNTISVVFLQGGGGYATCCPYSITGGACVLGDWVLEALNCTSANFSGCIRSEIQQTDISTDPTFLDSDNNSLNDFLMIPWYWGCWDGYPYSPAAYQNCRLYYNQEETKRQAFYTVAHELGHGFGLLHPSPQYENLTKPSIMTYFRSWPNNSLAKIVFYDEAYHVSQIPFFTNDNTTFENDPPRLFDTSYGWQTWPKRNDLFTIRGGSYGDNPDNLRVWFNTLLGSLPFPIDSLESDRQITARFPQEAISGSIWITKEDLKSNLLFYAVHDEENRAIPYFSCEITVIPDSVTQGQIINIDLSDSSTSPPIDRIYVYYRRDSNDTWRAINASATTTTPQECGKEVPYEQCSISCSDTICSGNLVWNTQNVDPAKYQVICSLHSFRQPDGLIYACNGDPDVTYPIVEEKHIFINNCGEESRKQLTVTPSFVNIIEPNVASFVSSNRVIFKALTPKDPRIKKVWLKHTAGATNVLPNFTGWVARANGTPEERSNTYVWTGDCEQPTGSCTSPIGHAWDTTNFKDGIHQLKAVAFDSYFGIISESDEITVNVSNHPPTPTPTCSPNGGTVSDCSQCCSKHCETSPLGPTICLP